jgi:lambda family phage portal protein
MVQLNMLGRLWTSELAAANHEADRVGIIKTAQGVPLEEAEDPATTAASMESEHIQYLGLQPGQDIVFPTIQHPNSQLAAFSTQLLKGVASGYGVSHHSFTGDVGDANFSGARIALMDERDGWRVRQQRMINSLHEVVFRDWIEMALLSGYLDLPVADPDKVCKPSWWPRTWDWVDPQKDVDAALTAIRGGLSTYQEELGKRGRDWRETFDQRSVEDSYAKEKQLQLDQPNTKAITKPAEPPADGAQPTKKGDANA